MSSKMYLSGLAAVATIVIVAAAQDPTFEYPAAKNAAFDVPQQSLFTYQSGEKVSVTFRNATVREVLDWLKNQGVSFVIADDQVNKESRVSVNVTNQPLDTVMKAFAAAWDGHWEKKSDMWVFRKGRDPFMDEPRMAQGLTKTFSNPDGVLNGRLSQLGDSKIVLPKDGRLKLLGDGSSVFVDGQMTKEQQAALDKAMKNMDDPKVWQEFEKNWEKWAKDYEKNYQEFEKNLNNKDFQFKFDQKQSEAFAKAAEEMRKSMSQNGKNPFGDGKNFQPFDAKQLEEMQKRALDLAKSSQGWSKATGSGKGLGWDGKDFKPMTDQQLKEMKQRINSISKSGANFKWDGKDFMPLTSKGWSGNGAYTTTSPHNLKAIYDVMTPKQREKMNRLGYINYSDLNSKQRALLGVITDDNWSITYKSDKANLTIKSDR